VQERPGDWRLCRTGMVGNLSKRFSSGLDSLDAHFI
jgi:hypothetical protein